MMHQSCLAMYELFKFKQKKVTIKSRCVKCMINNSKYLSKSDVWCWPMRAELALSDWTPTKHGHFSIVRASIIWRPNDFINLIISIFVIKSDQWFIPVMRCARSARSQPKSGYRATVTLTQSGNNILLATLRVMQTVSITPCKFSLAQLCVAYKTQHQVWFN